MMIGQSLTLLALALGSCLVSVAINSLRRPASIRVASPEIHGPSRDPSS